MSIVQRLGVLNLLPKGEKNKNYLANWRPITLLNTIYKIISGTIANRIKKFLPKLVSYDQKGFVPGRYIGEAIRSTYDIMQIAKDKKKLGLLLAIDFEKAYDSVSFSFIKKTLDFFNFGPKIIGWVTLLLEDFSAVVAHCGNLSRKFQIGRGCRQGDPIASILFILAIEILSIKIRKTESIKGFNSNLGEMGLFLRPTQGNMANDHTLREKNSQCEG